MLHTDCRYYRETARPTNPPGEEYMITRVPHCRLFNIDLKKCPQHCVYCFDWKGYKINDDL